MVSADDVLSGALALAVVLVPLFIGHLLNQRATRESFAREKSYERVRESYQQTLKSLGALLRAVRISRTQAEMHIALSAATQDTSKKVVLTLLPR
ncbi:MAG: hypothetical protein ACT4OI_06095 [Methanobacteriota archaeon]